MGEAILCELVDSLHNSIPHLGLCPWHMQRPQPLHPISHSMSCVQGLVALCRFSGGEKLVGRRVCTHNQEQLHAGTDS